MLDKFKEAYLKIILEQNLQDSVNNLADQKNANIKSDILINKDEIFDRLNSFENIPFEKFITVFCLLTDEDGYLMPQENVDFERNFKMRTWVIKGFEFKDYSNNILTLLMNVKSNTGEAEYLTYEISFKNIEPDADYATISNKLKGIFLKKSQISEDAVKFYGPEYTHLIYECGGPSDAYITHGCGSDSSTSFADFAKSFERMRKEKEEEEEKEEAMWQAKLVKLKTYGQFEKQSMMYIDLLRANNLDIPQAAAQILLEKAKTWLKEKIK